MKEQWKKVAGFEEFYEVSNLGRFRSLPKVINGRWGRTKYKGRIITPTKHSHGYGVLSLVGEDGKFSVRSHKYVALAFCDNPESKPCVNHIDGNKMNNRADNLEWVTHSENTLHAFKTGLMNNPSGSECHNSKLEENEVKHIRKMVDGGFYQQSFLAECYNVSKSTISDLIHRRTWKHI
jgi:hypothetical protein